MHVFLVDALNHGSDDLLSLYVWVAGRLQLLYV